MFLDVASKIFFVVCGKGNLLDGGCNVGRGGLVCLYMFL